MPASASAALQHDALVRLEGIAEWHRQSRDTEHDAEGRLRAVCERSGATSTYDYDARGNLASIAEPGGVARFTYDSRDRLVAVHERGGTVRYRYGANDRLVEVDEDGRTWRFAHDAEGRLIRSHAGSADAVVYRYDEHGRVVEARTSTLSTTFAYDPHGRTAAVTQVSNGVPVALAFGYDEAGRLGTIEYGPAGAWCRIEYAWDARGRPEEIRIGPHGGPGRAERGEELPGRAAVVRYAYDDATRTMTTTGSNGVATVSRADAIDARPASRQVLRGAEVLDTREFTWGRDGRLAGDGRRRWAYDEVGRLSAVGEGDRSWSYEYGPDDRRRHQPEHVRDDRGRARACGGRVFRFNDRDELIEVVREGVPVVRFEYDHKSRVAAACGVRGIRRYVYGPSDELLAIVDGQGRPVRLYVPTPFGPVATVEFSAPPADADGHGEASPVFLHLDDRGTSVLATDATGQVVARCEYDPFGMPLAPDADERHLFHGRPWSPEAGLYYFGARWFDPSLGEFLTRDSWTARPDDYRLVNAVVPASGQRAARAWMLGDWLRHPRSRNPWAFCGHDPVGYSDPNGHWSFGGVLLSVLGAIWTLPNTLLGILIEITCLIGEVVRWLVWLVTGGNVSWATPGFDVAASGRLNAFALVFRGGWLGSFKSLLGITFGNVFFVYHDWENHPEIAAGGTVSPSAYGGTVTFPRSEALYEHELRHTNQYAWFGPFYHLGLPIWGVYLWDIIFNGYENSWCERDARAHAF